MDPSPSPIVITPYGIASVVTCLLAYSLGFLVYRKDPSRPAYRMWFLMSLSISGWAFWLAASFLTTDKTVALWTVRIGDLCSLFIPITYLHFAMHYVGRLQKQILKAGYLISILLAATAGSPFFISDVSYKFGIWYEVSGPGMAVSLLLYVLCPSYGILLFAKTLPRTTGIKRSQLKSIMAASIVGFSGGLMWFLPGFHIDIPPIGGLFVSLYCIILFYAILKYQWMDVQLVIRRSLIYSILVTLLTAGYFGLIYGLEALFRTTLGYQSLWLSLTALALMTLAFQPLKVGIQRLVDLAIFRTPQEALAKRVERLEEQARLAEKFKAASTLAAGMAHEIKNPLTSLKTFAEFLPERYRDPIFIRQCSQIFHQETNRIQKLVQDVLDFAKPRPPQPKPIDPTSLIESTVNFLSGELIGRGIKWETTYRHNGHLIQADPDQLRQVLINLIQNAADAMPAGGQLRITTQPANGHLELAVSDTGGGIPKELLPKIFDPFVTTKEGGNGLGLAMVYSILRANRGSIRAQNNPEHGTTFTVQLPV